MSPLHYVSPQDLKMVGASALAVIATAAEALATPAGWESLTLKGVLIIAVVYLVREIKTLRDRTEAEAARRETALVEALRKNEEAMHELKAATIEQTGWFKTVAQTVINRDISPHLPQ